MQNEKGNMLHVTFGKALKGLKEKGPHLISFPNMIWGGEVRRKNSNDGWPSQKNRKIISPDC